MTNSGSDRLDIITDRLDIITNVLNVVVETAVKNENNITELTSNVDRLTLKVGEHDRLIDGLIIATQQNTEAISSLNNYAREIFERFDIMQGEIRGLQTENRRILDRLENN